MKATHKVDPYPLSGRLDLGRIAGIFTAACMCFPAFAQEVPVYQHLLQLAHTSEKAAFGPALEMLSTQQPVKVIWHEATGTAEVHTHTLVPYSQWNDLLAGSGIEVGAVAVYSAASTQLLSTDGPGLEPFPRYWDTGNPDLDHARYVQAKSRWVDAHPEAYQEMSGNGPPVDHK